MGDATAGNPGRPNGSAGWTWHPNLACRVDPDATRRTGSAGRHLVPGSTGAAELEAEGFAVARVSDYLEEPDTVVWLDLCAPRRDELHVISEELNLSSLAVEDAVSPRERPKLDRYDSHLFLNAYSVSFDRDSGEVATHEVAAFITEKALVTVRQDEGFDVDGLLAHWGEVGQELGQYGVRYLVHGLLDFIVDQHFAAVQSLDTEIETLEDLLFDDAPHDADVQRRSFELRKSLVLLRRVVLPMREVVNTLMRRDLHLVDEAMVPYYQDVYDHVLRATEWTECLRDLVTTILETNLTIQGNRMNLIMKKVTAGPRSSPCPPRSPVSTVRTFPTPDSARNGDSPSASACFLAARASSTSLSNAATGCRPTPEFPTLQARRTSRELRMTSRLEPAFRPARPPRFRRCDEGGCLS